MKDKTTYFIKPKMRKHWFVKYKKVYDLFEEIEGERWIDPSYGNGGADLIPFGVTNKIYTFKTLTEAQQFKKELEMETHTALEILEEQGIDYRNFESDLY